jgi:hypothetical protein
MDLGVQIDRPCCNRPDKGTSSNVLVVNPRLASAARSRLENILSCNRSSRALSWSCPRQILAHPLISSFILARGVYARYLTMSIYRLQWCLVESQVGEVRERSLSAPRLPRTGTTADMQPIFCPKGEARLHYQTALVPTHQPVEDRSEHTNTCYGNE